MVRSMMSQTTLPKSFWDYALETAACILNMVPTKKVEKTPYEQYKDMFLVYGGYHKTRAQGFCYTDAISDDLIPQVPQQDMCSLLNGGALVKSVKQSIFATSSAEAEYISAFLIAS
ncbi:hypothetical protein Tco_0907657 [Tanacetum coccineum]|uniref:Polyprotein n=1 Tax=Tanacetum coccineum TaxID=301880 RepID=A0ABQ5CLC1_9ASTR